MNTIESQLMDIIRQQDGTAQQTGSIGENVNGEGDADRYSRKVFVGGLPPDIDEDEIQAAFRRYGPLIVDWPHKNESKSYFPPKVGFTPFPDRSRKCNFNLFRDMRFCYFKTRLVFINLYKFV